MELTSNVFIVTSNNLVDAFMKRVVKVIIAKLEQALRSTEALLAHTNTLTVRQCNRLLQVGIRGYLVCGVQGNVTKLLLNMLYCFIFDIIPLFF